VAIQVPNRLEIFGKSTSSVLQHGRRSTSPHNNHLQRGSITVQASVVLVQLQAWWSFLEGEGQTRFRWTTLGVWESTETVASIGWKHHHETTSNPQNAINTAPSLLARCYWSLEAEIIQLDSPYHWTFTTPIPQIGTGWLISNDSDTHVSWLTTIFSFMVDLTRKCPTFPQIKYCAWI